LAKERDLLTIGIVNVPDSLLARETDCGVYLNAGREVAVASTKSFTNQCIVLALVAVWFSQNRGTCPLRRQKIVQDLRNVSAQIQAVIDKRDEVQAMVQTIANAQSMFLLGKGSEEAVAKEGALKIKEVAYIHAEGYSTSALKHGPFALLVQDVPVILLDIGEVHRDKTRNAYQEVAARDAHVVCICDQVLDHTLDHTLDQGSSTGSSTHTLLVPTNATFGGIVANVYVQMLSYELAVHMGNNPDCPRNLAKVVTVE
jgi:glucosamine--fructose-6-phosphate aminotransferase (isomerizing)